MRFDPQKEYSQEELRLFEHFGYLDLATSMMAPALYRICVEKAFLDNIQGPAVDALRRGAKAINDCTPYRMTREFNALVDFEQHPMFGAP